MLIDPHFCFRGKIGILPLKQKWAWMHFQWEYAWLSVWHNISTTTMRDRAMVWFQRTTYRKLHTRRPMVTWLMTSRDPKRSRSWLQNLLSSISQQPCEIRGRITLTTNRKVHIASLMVTWPMTSRDPKCQSRDPNILKLNISKTVRDTWSFRIDY